MDRHQILTGAVNSGDACYSVGSVEGVSFTAYAAGCDIVILASDFQRVQIIPGATHGNIQVRCVDCSSDTGKIAASYDKQVLVFEPTPLLHHTSTHKLDYQWYQTSSLKCECHVNALSWNLEGTRLLVGGACIQLWQSPDEHGATGDTSGGDGAVGFTLGAAEDDDEPEWCCIWKCYTAYPVYHLRFSPDGLLFASAGKHDRLVKVWYENKKTQMLSGDSMDFSDQLDYSFCYVAHPSPVTEFSWRRISKYMPRGTVTNVLMTWSKDSICRLWSETVLPDDGLVDVQQFDINSSQNPKLNATRHKNRFVQKLSHVRHAMHKRRKHKKEGRSQGMRVQPLSTPESSHDFHKYWIQQNGLTPVLHFHLAATINPLTDIPLNPTVNNSYEGDFVVHWLNNKELQFTMESEKLMNEINQRLLTTQDEHNSDSEGGNHSDHGTDKKHKRSLWNRISSHGKLNHIDSEGDVEHSSNLPHSHSATGELSNRSQFNTSVDNETHTNLTKASFDDSFDRNIERMLKAWHSSADVLFSIHPGDGSFLVWLVDYLDEIEPGCFRQAQVTFSSRIPNAIPVGDAMSMSANAMTYCTNSPLEIHQQNGSTSTANYPHFNLMPHICMVTKHFNGSLNLWKVNFAERSDYRTVLSLSHWSRACGHRFRTNSAASHPVLPLLITTSHHNIPTSLNPTTPANTPMDDMGPGSPREFDPAVGLSSELILWRVDPVGPLSVSGGVTELAKINSPNIAAFDNVAWLPTLLPSSALGSSCNSPSSLFVASDGLNLRIYQAVIDARGILAETPHRAFTRGRSTGSSSSSLDALNVPTFPTSQSGNQFHGYNIVSEQSTSRPGCIIELDTVKAAQHEWTNTQLLHVFQGQLISGECTDNHNTAAFIDLRDIGSFEEKFYLVVLEKQADNNSYLHMWEIVISSFLTDDASNQPTGKKEGSTSDQDSDASSEPQFDTNSGPQFKICTNKVYGHRLSLPDGVQVLDAASAAGHVGSSTIYPACFAPYLFATACSDGFTRFWACSPVGKHYNWHEWRMIGQENSAICVPGRPITVSCAYTGRISIAYRFGRVMAAKDNPYNKYVNLYVVIYECESTGGSEWVQEDILELKNIFIPDPKAEIDLSVILGNERKISQVLSSENFFKMQFGTHALPSYHPSPHNISPSASSSKLPHVPSIPSLSCIHSVKKSIAKTGNKTGVLQQKHLVQLDWAPTEDGGHVLTVAVGSKILFFCPVSNEIAETAQLVAAESNDRTGPPVIERQKSLSMTVAPQKSPTIRWLRLRNIELSTADGLPPLPMHVSWAKEGVLIVGMDNEMHVYSQWHGPQHYHDVSGLGQTQIPSLSQLKPSTTLAGSMNDAPPTGKLSTLRISQSVPHLHRIMSSKISEKRDRRDGTLKRVPTQNKVMESLPPLVSILQDMLKAKGHLPKDSALRLDLSDCFDKECGLFEAVQITNPVLPQYHPKQLLELLNFGKVRRVKAILAHLMHCISGNISLNEEEEVVPFRPRAMSVHQVAKTKGKVQVAEETTSYVEISSIPPLPLFCLLAADNDVIYATAEGPTPGGPAANSNYNELFTEGPEDELDLTFDDDQPKRRHSSAAGQRSKFLFGHKESEHLSGCLLHVRLPGLSNLDQMYLTALADTVAHTHTDFSDKFTSEKSLSSDMDDCGLRYIVAVGHSTYLSRTLSPAQRHLYKKSGLPTSDVIWGFHSESEEEIVSKLPGMNKDEPKWEELKSYGIGWILTDPNVLKRTVEKIAKTAFQTTKDPMDSAIFYLAMKKKMILWGLYRSVGNEKMQAFFKNDFTQERWRKAALKNAYALLGLQRFEHAAAFFLLAGALKDAVDICLTKLHDLQLAILIARLHSSDLTESRLPQSVIDILNQEVLGGESSDSNLMHPDPFLRSIAFWMCKHYKKSLQALLEPNVGYHHPKYKDYHDVEEISVFNFYNYLRTHPLLLRQRLANHADHKKMHTAALLSGFSHTPAESDQVMTIGDKITPQERRLYFSTAHDHFKAGCPALALEVLTKLPKVADLTSCMETEEEEEEPAQLETNEISRHRSLINEPTMDWGAPVATQVPEKKAEQSIDWGAPLSQQQNYESTPAMDWAAPVTNTFGAGRPVDGEPPSFSVLSSGDDDSSSEDEGLVMKKVSASSIDEPSDTEEESLPATDDTNHLGVHQPQRPSTLMPPSPGSRSRSPASSIQESDQRYMNFDVMSQQLKFIACLKIAMEELATLATGFEVEGGQLRYQLYIWLEKEVDVLKVLCNYGQTITDVEAEAVKMGPAAPSVISLDADQEWQTASISGNSSQASAQAGVNRANLHEVIMAEKMDFEAKLQRLAKRKQWLKRNQQLLRTLLTYCSLYGASGGGLACIKMELILLMQELQQERTQKQLLSPLPFPTTLPLLSASVANSKTVIVDPITFLQSSTQDLLSSVLTMSEPPDYTGNLHRVVTIRNLSTALSSCIYECLCDSDSIVVGKVENDVGLEGFTNVSTSVVYKDSFLMAGARKKHHHSSSVNETPSSPPAKWPGTTQLITMLMTERDHDAPKMPLLLCESLFSVHISILIHALTFYETNVLYRMAVHTFSDKMWSTLFGGGVKSLVTQRTTSFLESCHTPAQQQTNESDGAKYRMKLHMKLGASPSPARPASTKPTYQEKFVPPKMSMVNYLISKPHMSSVPYGIDYDSDDLEEDEDEEEEENDDEDIGNEEHMNPESFSWCLVRLVMIKHVLHSINTFLPSIGIEPSDLPSCSPLLHSVIRNIEGWETQLTALMDKFEGPPEGYIPGLSVNRAAVGPSINKYKSMLGPENTPFRSNAHAALPCRRLWFYLVHQEHLQETFICYLFKKKRKVNSHQSDMTDYQPSRSFGTKIIHKDPEIVSTFCVNESNEDMLSMATHKEMLELDVSTLMRPPVWLDENEDSDDEDSFGRGSDFVTINAPERKPGDFWTASAGNMSSSNLPSQTGRGTTMAMRHNVKDVIQMGNHPLFPYYLTGGTDGAVRIYEYGHAVPLHEPRHPGTAPKPTRVQFNAQGNKFGVTDVEGNLSLYQVTFGTNVSTPYLNMKCQNKSTNDFVFISSSSFLATAGHSSDGHNVGMWDTLLPQRCSLIQSFHCNEHGSTALLYAPQHQLLVAGGKKGDVCIFDVRQRKQLHTFPVHESAVKCMALDPCEEFFVTGSADGDIKVWGLSMHQLLKTYPGEHSKTSMFSRMNSGVLKLHVTNTGHLFSAGADGTLKVRLIGSDMLSSSNSGVGLASFAAMNDYAGPSKTVTFSL